MSPTEPGDNRLYTDADQLPPELWRDLRARDPREAAQAVGASWEKGAYQIDLLGSAYVVDTNARQVRRADDPARPVSFQAGMILVVTLAKSQGIPPAGRMATPQELPGGALFFTGPHAINNSALCARFGQDPGALITRAAAWGGEAMEGADAAIKAPGLPLVPVYALIWGEDEEFSARAVVGLDAHAHHHLPLDAVWALTNLFIKKLAGE